MLGEGGVVRVLRVFVFTLLLTITLRAQAWQPLFDGKNLDAWEVRGQGDWTILPDGTLLGQRRHEKVSNPFGDSWPLSQKQFRDWVYQQAWLYTKQQFTDFDLHVEYLVPPHQNSGVSIRDESRAHWVIGEPDTTWTPKDTAHKGSPAHIGYEIQIIDGDSDRYSSGSVYLFQAAKTGVQKKAAWNEMDIESRKDLIRVSLNGTVVAESPGDPARSKTGPIGLQLHDQYTFIMFRNIRIRPR